MKDLKQLETLEKIKLADISNHAENCDILIYFGDCWLSESIKFVTDTPISHIGMYVDFYGIPAVMEADGDVHLITLENSLKQGGRIFVARYKDLTEDQKLKIIRAGVPRLQDDYDWSAVEEITVNAVVDVFEYKEDDKFYCSEYFEYMFAHAGKKFKRDSNGYSLPRFIALDDNVVPICEVIL